MAVLTPVRAEDALAFAKGYDLGNFCGLDGIAAGSVNSNFALTLEAGRFFLRIYEEQGWDGARAEAARLVELASRGVPTPPPVARRDGEFVAELSGKPAVLFPWRDGGMRCQASLTEGATRRVGAALARIHAAGEGLQAPKGRFDADALFARIDRIAADPVWRPEAEWLRDKLASWSARRDPSLPRGLIHSDLFRDNVLWSGDGEIAALLDFESACSGTFAYDLAVTLLAWCYGDRLDRSLARGLVEGYEGVRALTPPERRGLHAEAAFAALRFTITRITDYAMRPSGDGPRSVKDWRRFKARLAEVEMWGERGFNDALGYG